MRARWCRLWPRRRQLPGSVSNLLSMHLHSDHDGNHRGNPSRIPLCQLHRQVRWSRRKCLQMPPLLWGGHHAGSGQPRPTRQRRQRRQRLNSEMAGKEAEGRRSGWRSSRSQWRGIALLLQGRWCKDKKPLAKYSPRTGLPI